MLRTLLATTAIATLVSTGAFAQAQPAPMQPVAPATEAAPGGSMAAPAPETVAPAAGYLASNVLGESVYNGTADNAELIGNVNDIVIGEDGGIEAVVIGVGGFLGIGEKNVALAYDEFEWAERDGDRWLVVNTTKEQLEKVAEFDDAPYEPVQAASTETAAPPADQTAQAPADGTMAAPDTTRTAAIDKSTLTDLPADQIRSEELVGTTVYGADDANVGEIGDVIVASDGKVDAVIIDVGGFLGIGEKEVAVGMDNLAFMTDADGNKYLYTNFTKEQLDAQAAYDESTWAEKRDEQRLIITQ